MKYPDKQGPVSGIKDKYARTELSRAHAMVALLSFACITLLVVAYRSIATIPTVLFVSAILLLGLVALFSACVTIGLMRKVSK